MKNSYRISCTNTLLSLALLTGGVLPAIAQTAGNSSNSDPAPTVQVDRDATVNSDVRNDADDNCLQSQADVAGTQNADATVPGSPEVLGSDSRLDSSRVNCLDAHTDDPHPDNLRFENSNTPDPTERTDLIIDEEQRDSTDVD